jgi:LDH2 family malate/lactate/ureidoglycolate dehydrogenase
MQTSQDPTPQQRKGRITQADARAFATQVLQGNGMAPEDAATVADCLVAADLRGVDTHGINRLPSYMTRARKGLADPRAQPAITEITPVVAQVDGKNAFGAIPSKMGMAKAIEMARAFGIGMVSIKHSNHFGMSAWLCQQAIDAGMLSLVFTNSSPALPAWGGRSKLLGVSPIGCFSRGRLSSSARKSARGMGFLSSRLRSRR